jgi:putative spermidine/putrescine transport system permease protein
MMSGAVALLLVFFAWPLVDLVRISLDQGLSGYRDYFASSADVKALTRTVGMAALVAVVCVAVGSFLAWQLYTATSRIVKGAILVAVVFPLWTGIVVRNYALTVMFQKNGVVNDVLQFTGLADQPVRILFTEVAVVLGMVYIMLPYAVLTVYATFANLNLDLVRASRTLGGSALDAWRTVVIPLALPGLLASGALVLVVCLGFYVTPIVLGGAESPFVTTRIATQVFTRFDLTAAATGSVILLICAALVLAVTWRLVGADRLRKAWEQ